MQLIDEPTLAAKFYTLDLLMVTGNWLAISAAHRPGSLCTAVPLGGREDTEMGLIRVEAAAAQYGVWARRQDVQGLLHCHHYSALVFLPFIAFFTALCAQYRR
jgi:hypothetical protein